MTSALNELRNKSGSRGAQFVPIGIPTVCCKTRPSNITNMLSIKNSRMLMISVSENVLVDPECFFKIKYVPSWQVICIYVGHSIYETFFQLRVGNSCVKCKEAKCFNAIAGGEYHVLSSRLSHVFWLVKHLNIVGGIRLQSS